MSGHCQGRQRLARVKRTVAVHGLRVIAVQARPGAGTAAGPFPLPEGNHGGASLQGTPGRPARNEFLHPFLALARPTFRRRRQCALHEKMATFLVRISAGIRESGQPFLSGGLGNLWLAARRSGHALAYSSSYAHGWPWLSVGLGFLLFPCHPQPVNGYSVPCPQTPPNRQRGRTAIVVSPDRRPGDSRRMTSPR
jgi:hypothetical protein